LKELAEPGVSFVSLTEGLDVTTPTGRAMPDCFRCSRSSKHEIPRVRIRAGIAEARLKGKRFGRPLSGAKTVRAFSDGSQPEDSLENGSPPGRT
jgi:putative DNA-invertase from lambdoid prophage Rac